MFMELFNSWCFYPTISNDIESYGVMDEENGLQFMRARYYDPELGRFLSEDLLLSLNLYAYVSNNPISKMC